MSRKDTHRFDPEVARARKRAAFIATLRRSHAGVSTAPAATRVVEAEVARKEITRVEAPARTGAPTATKPPTQAVTRAATRAPAQAAAPAGQLFREQALRHRLAAEEGRGLVRVSPPWTWAVLCCVVVGLAAAIVTSFVGRVEVTSRGRGVLRPKAGVRIVSSQMTGTITRVEVRSGERVRAGDVLLRIDSPTAQAQLLEADRQLEAVRTQFSATASQQDQHYAQQIDSLKARAARITDQIASLRASQAHQERRLEADLQLVRKGLVSELAAGETREALAQIQRQVGGAQQSLDQTRQELASLEARRQDELWQRQQVVSAAQTRRDSLAVTLQQGAVVAPEDGIVEALAARAGEAVQAGQVLGKIVPVDSPLQVVSFVAERDRAFAKPGDEARLELDQLPHAEYGTLRARIVRIGDDLASAPEVVEAFGDGQKLETPSYRVELEVTDAGAAEAASVKLRTGALMNVRYTLRHQRLVTLVFGPLKRWLR
jgi:multidrug resistance efflux pump